MMKVILLEDERKLAFGPLQTIKRPLFSNKVPFCTQNGIIIRN